ncbi:MAG: hypothetical protein LBS69_12220 [Prevotellaceae bacterium]|jgi:hypothetical protein|nr:hypothetical protein [Prevotellaceae bacterium]
MENKLIDKKFSHAELMVAFDVLYTVGDAYINAGKHLDYLVINDVQKIIILAARVHENGAEKE